MQRGHQRTKAQREKDFERIAELYCKGLSLRVMAEVLSSERDYSISFRQIGSDVKKLLKRWRGNANQNIEAFITVELEKINNLERVYWDAWERSLTMRVSNTQEVIGSSEAYDKIKKVKKEENYMGTPAYLAGVQWCIERRCKLLGLDAPSKSVHDIKGKMSLEQLCALIPEENKMEENGTTSMDMAEE